MNGNTQKLIWWILGALLVVTMSLSSTLFGMIQQDITRIEQRQVVIEQKIEQVQLEYYKIDVIQQQLEELTKEIRMRKFAK